MIPVDNNVEKNEILVLIENMPLYLRQHTLYPRLSTFHAKNSGRIIFQILTIPVDNNAKKMKS